MPAFGQKRTFAYGLVYCAIRPSASKVVASGLKLNRGVGDMELSERHSSLDWVRRPLMFSVCNLWMLNLVLIGHAHLSKGAGIGWLEVAVGGIGLLVMPFWQVKPESIRVSHRPGFIILSVVLGLLGINTLVNYLPT